MKKIFLSLVALCLLAAPALAADPTITVLNTANGESGPAQSIRDTVLDKDLPTFFVANVSTGDTVKVQGRASATDSWIDIYSFTADEWRQIWLPRQWRVIRSTNGGGGVATVKVLNTLNIPLVAH